MAFLCPVRIPRRRRKRRDGETSAKNGAPKGRITGSNSVDSLVALGKDSEEDEIEFEPRKMVVLHDFIPCVEDEVSVKRGEHVKALYQETDWLYISKLDDTEGFIPHTYCVTENEYEKRKEKQKTVPSGVKDFLKSPLLAAMVTQSSFEPAEFAKQNYGDFIVKFDFDASDEDDVSVRKGEVVKVLNKEDQDWYWVRKKSGNEGFIPKDFITKLAIEQTEPSGSLMNRGPLSKSNPNIYSSSKMSPHSAVIAASSCTSFSRTDQPTLPANTRVIPLSSTRSIDYSSSATNSSRSSSQTPVISADQSSTSLSRFEQNSPFSNHVTPLSTFATVIRNVPEGKTSRRSSSDTLDKMDIFTSTSQPDFTMTTSNTPRVSTASTLLITDENHNLKQPNSNVSFKPFSSMSRLDQRHFVSDKHDNYQLSQSLGSSYNQSRRKSNDLLLYGQELVCTDTHIGREVDELTVYKGDWIYADMKCRNGRGWVWAYSPASKNQGFVPKSCLRPPATTPL